MNCVQSASRHLPLLQPVLKGSKLHMWREAPRGWMCPVMTVTLLLGEAGKGCSEGAQMSC